MTTFQGPSSPAAPPDRRAAYRRLVLAAARGASLTEVAHIGLSAACAVCGAPVGQVSVIVNYDQLPQPVPPPLESVLVVGTTGHPGLAAALTEGPPATPSATATALATGRVCVSPPDGGKSDVHLLVVPISHGDFVGVIELANDRPFTADPATLDVLRDLAEVIGAVVAREREFETAAAVNESDTALERAVRERLEMDQQRLLAAEVIGSFGVWELVPGQQFVWSDQLRRIHGVGPDFIPTLDSNLALVYPDDLHVVYDSMAGMRADGADGAAAPIQHRIVRPDGEIRWIETHVKLLEGARAIGITRDITEQRARQWRERLRTKISQTIKEGVALVSPDEVILFVSPQWAAMFGHEPDEMEGRSIWDFSLRDGDGPLMAIDGDRSDGVQREIRHRHRDGSIFTTEASITRMPLEDGAPGELAWLAVERDITDEKAQSEARRLAEEALSRYAADLEQSNAELRRAKADAEAANKAKNEFLSRMSHELRTPLNAVLGYAELLGMEEDLADPQLDMVHQVLRGGRHLLMLIDEVLDIARMENGTMAMVIEPIEVAAAIDHACSLLDPLVRERQVRVRTPRFVDAFPPVVLADRQRVVQILLNLLSNAVKYNVFGGEVRVAVDADRDRVALSVTDTGPGIAPEVLPRLFEPFDRLGAEQTDVEGTGIGLTVSRALAEQMGGNLTVRSTPGEGSTFTLELPVVARAKATPTL